MKRDKKLITERNQAIKKRYDHLYNVDRLRHDDVLEKLESEFWLKRRTLFRILFNKQSNNTANNIEVDQDLQVVQHDIPQIQNI